MTRDWSWINPDTYSDPEITGTPLEGEQAVVTYLSRRSGNRITVRGTVKRVENNIHDDNPEYSLIRLDPTDRDRELDVWLGGGYKPEKHGIDPPEGTAPANVSVEYSRRNPNADGYDFSFQRQRLGRVVKAEFPTHRITFEITNSPDERANAEHLRNQLNEYLTRHKLGRSGDRIKAEIVEDEIVQPDD